MGQPEPQYLKPAPDQNDQVSADIYAMYVDAAEWDFHAERMGEAATSAQQLTLSDHDISLFGVESGFADDYREMHRWATGLLKGAHKNLADMAKALRTSADNYEAKDAHGAATFDHIDPGGN